jgi:AP-2 complex subunit beta-1
LDALLRFVPEKHEDAQIMAERVVIQLQHANSAVVLTTIKVLLYLMNYMENRKLIDYICKKMGPPLGSLFIHSSTAHLEMDVFSNFIIVRTGGTVRCPAKYSAHHPASTTSPEE